MQKTALPCNRCKRPVEVLGDLAIAGAHGVLCDDCQEIERNESIARQHRRLMIGKWEAICPPIYRDTQLDLLPCPDLTAKALTWPNNDRTRGLNLWGFPATGKTRTTMLILHREHFGGSSVIFLGPGAFGQGCEQRNYNTAPWLLRLGKYDIVVFDDVDKLRMTKHHEAKFFELIDNRCRNNKPTFYTGNANGDTLKTTFRSGEALVRRMREQATSIHFAQQKNLSL